MITKTLQNDKLRFCRIKKGTKKPFEKEWTKKLYTYKEIEKFLPKENYGVLCGHGDLAVIDSDNEALQIAVEYLLPKTYKVRTGGGGTHNYYFIPELKQKIILEMEDGLHLGEVQSYGTQVVAPSSIHPNGKEYEEMNQEEITTLPCEKLLEVIRPFMKEAKQVEETAEFERKESSEIDSLSVADIWGTAGLKKHENEYYGEHPIHGSAGGMNFWINPLKNTWHCFRCQSGGGVLSAIAVKEGLIDCSEATRGGLRGNKAREAIRIAKEKYGLKDTPFKFGDLLDSPLRNYEKDESINIIWNDELQSYTEEDKEWIIDKLIPSKSIVILTGKRGTLKTFITLAMAYSIATGEPFLEQYETQKGKVIYLDKENGIGIMKNRTSMIERGMDLNIKGKELGFICFSQLKLDRLGDIIAIEKVIEEYKPKVLIVDTYRRCVGFDENDAGKVSELFVDTLRPIVEKYNTSVILIHHNRKSSGQGTSDEMDELRGSSDLANYADIILKTERKGEKLILKQLKNRNAQEIEPMQINIIFDEEKNNIKLKYEGDFVKQSKSDKCAEYLIIWFNEKDIKTFKTGEAKNIANRKGYKETNFKSALILLQDRGIIESIGFGMYKVK